jgi:hypothetical protein
MPNTHPDTAFEEIMTGKLPHKETRLDGRELTVRFSEPVMEAFHELAEVAQNSKHFDPQVHAILKSWSNDKPTTVHDVINSLPLIAGQMAAHISATKDDAAKDIWDSLSTQIAEHGFTVSESRQRKR